MRRERRTAAEWVVVVLAVIMFAAVLGVLVLTVRNLTSDSERRTQEALANAAVVLEIRAQSRLNACLTLKLAKRHGVDTSGLDSPACKVLPNGEVVFPGVEPGNSLNAGADSGSDAGAGGANGDGSGSKPGSQPGEDAPPGESPPGGGPPGPPNPPPGSPNPPGNPPGLCIDAIVCVPGLPFGMLT